MHKLCDKIKRGEILESLKIVEYDEKYKQDLMDISMEWLLKYDLLEEEDYVMLRNPKEEVIDKGGHIFFAEYNGDVVGTVALDRMDENECEVLKFGVKETAQGKGVGIALMKRLMEVAKEEGYKKILLCSNHQLESAIHIYKKLGFEFIPFQNSRFEISDTMMEYKL